MSDVLIPPVDADAHASVRQPLNIRLARHALSLASTRDRHVSHPHPGQPGRGGERLAQQVRQQGLEGFAYRHEPIPIGAAADAGARPVDRSEGSPLSRRSRAAGSTPRTAAGGAPIPDPVHGAKMPGRARSVIRTTAGAKQ